MFDLSCFQEGLLTPLGTQQEAYLLEGRWSKVSEKNVLLGLD